MENQYSRKRKIIGVAVLALVIAILAVITWAITKRILEIGSAPGDVKEFIGSFGWAGWLVALGLQFLQILVAFIPGELIETGMGYAFGAVVGTLLCYMGLALGEFAVFVIIRRLGKRAVEYFVPLEKLGKFSFLNDESRLKKTVFILFIIPGTPKDLLTYFAPLTKIKLSEFLTISLIARFPSVVSSTIGGNMLGEGRYLHAAILYTVTGIVSLLGLKIYDIILKKKQAHNGKRKTI